MDFTEAPQETHLNSLQSLFPKGRTFHVKTEEERKRELTDYFSEKLGRSKRLIALRLNMARYTLDDRDYLKSAYKDRLIRPCGPCLKDGFTAACVHSKATADRYFWWITRTKKA